MEKSACETQSEAPQLSRAACYGLYVAGFRKREGTGELGLLLFCQRCSRDCNQTTCLRVDLVRRSDVVKMRASMNVRLSLDADPEVLSAEIAGSLGELSDFNFKLMIISLSSSSIAPLSKETFESVCDQIHSALQETTDSVSKEGDQRSCVSVCAYRGSLATGYVFDVLWRTHEECYNALRQRSATTLAVLSSQCLRHVLHGQGISTLTVTLTVDPTDWTRTSYSCPSPRHGSLLAADRRHYRGAGFIFTRHAQALTDRALAVHLLMGSSWRDKGGGSYGTEFLGFGKRVQCDRGDPLATAVRKLWIQAGQPWPQDLLPSLVDHIRQSAYPTTNEGDDDGGPAVGAHPAYAHAQGGREEEEEADRLTECTGDPVATQHTGDPRALTILQSVSRRTEGRPVEADAASSCHTTLPPAQEGQAEQGRMHGPRGAVLWVPASGEEGAGRDGLSKTGSGSEIRSIFFLLPWSVVVHWIGSTLSTPALFLPCGLSMQDRERMQRFADGITTAHSTRIEEVVSTLSLEAGPDAAQPNSASEQGVGLYTATAYRLAMKARGVPSPRDYDPLHKLYWIDVHMLKQYVLTTVAPSQAAGGGELPLPLPGRVQDAQGEERPPLAEWLRVAIRRIPDLQALSTGAVRNEDSVAPIPTRTPTLRW